MAVRVGVWGLWGYGNYGNEATLAAFLTRLGDQEYRPILLTEAPKEAARLHQLSARNIGPAFVDAGGGLVRRALRIAGNRIGYLRAAFALVAELDAIVVPGTGGLERYGSGAFGTPFEMWALGVASRLRRRPFVLLDIGVEHLPRRLARRFARGALRAATDCSFRDEPSRENALAMAGRVRGGRVATDLAFGLEPRLAPNRDARRVLLGVMDYWGRDSRSDASAARESYLHRLSALVTLLGEHDRDVELVAGDAVDLRMARQLAEHTGTPLVIHEASTPEALTELLSSAHVAVATRYHTLVLALLSGTPAVSIGYGEKHGALLRQLGLPEHHRDIEGFEPTEVAELVLRAAADFDRLSPRVLAGVAAARDRLRVQWPEVDRAMHDERNGARR